jgi:hypothetical protein
VNLEQLVEQYLCAVFSQIRIMANYFRKTLDLFYTDSDTYRRFDYVIKRQVPSLAAEQFPNWRTGFLLGLNKSCQQGNSYVPAVFHNVLATYYLNRHTQASAYQIAKLTERDIYIDTNVLYSLLVPASPYHELASYVAQRLRTLGVWLKVFPFTLSEYESSLEAVERHHSQSGPSRFLVCWNPWLYQEFKANSAKYLGRLGICRQVYSVAKDLPITEQNYDEIDRRLREKGVTLQTDFKAYGEEEVQELWVTLRNAMASSKWDLYQYWEFIYGPGEWAEKRIRHDAWCLRNVMEKNQGAVRDELGPKVFFVTLDSKLLRLRHEYQWILSVDHFAEFVLPYLFLADIPISDAERFPNQLLAAQLGTLLVERPPDLAEVVGMFLKQPDLLERGSPGLSETAQDMARVLSTDRFRHIVEAAQGVDDAQKEVIARETAGVLEEVLRLRAEEYYRSRSLTLDVGNLKEELGALKAKNEKLQKTVRYWKQRARR